MNYEVVKKQEHITPKNTDMLEYIIKTSSNESDLILDCFMGSGTTGVAALNTNRKFIGIEKDENYFNIAKNRIESTYKERKAKDIGENEFVVINSPKQVIDEGLKSKCVDQKANLVEVFKNLK